MKKVYEKPAIVFENFSLSTSIAAGCEAKTNLPSNKACGMDFSGTIIFLDTMGGCEDKITSTGGDGEWNGICYHTFNGENLFNS